MIIGSSVCEFNPFHTGHKYLLENMGKDGVTHKICIMSGNFVQRGEFAVCDKYIRADAAVANGADLVIELPLPYAVSTAESFARGSIGLLNKLNCIDALYFGAENTIDEIEEVIKRSETEECENKIKSLMDSGISYPDAFQEAIGSLVLQGANNTLAIEYIKQLRKLRGNIRYKAIERIGANHDSNEETGGYMSASAIREKLRKGKDCSGFLPYEIHQSDICDQSKLELAFLAKFRTMGESDFAKIADVNEGLEYRIKRSVQNSKTVSELLKNIKTKRYTNAKIRRILLCAFLGVTKQMQSEIPNFINVLAANKKGIEILSQIKAKSDVKIVTRFADTEILSENDKKLYEFTCMCDDIYSLALPEVRDAGYDKMRKFSVHAE